MRVYYLTGAQFALHNIALRRLKISRFSELNDPFELLSANRSDKNLRKKLREFTEETNKSSGLICFAGTWENPVLWSHYADKHRGVCLGFDIPNGLLKSVIYENKLRNISLIGDELPKTVKEGLRLIKYKHWRYEDEKRLFISLEDRTQEAGLYFLPFTKDLVLREVILGHRCELPIPRIRELLEAHNPSVSVIQARIAFTRYGVVINKVKTGSS